MEIFFSLLKSIFCFQVFIVPVDNVDGPVGVSAPVPAPRSTNHSPTQTHAIVRTPAPAVVVPSPQTPSGSPAQSPVQSPVQSPSLAPSQPISLMSQTAEQDSDTQSPISSPPGCRSMPEGRDDDSQASCEGSNAVPSSPSNSHGGSPAPLGMLAVCIRLYNSS